MIEIDGAQKSGSGTIVRDAVSLSVLVGQELHVTNIRAKRDKVIPQNDMQLQKIT